MLRREDLGSESTLIRQAYPNCVLDRVSASLPIIDQCVESLPRMPGDEVSFGVLCFRSSTWLPSKNHFATGNIGPAANASVNLGASHSLDWLKSFSGVSAAAT